MNLIASGINHRTAPLEVRERVWLSDTETRKALSLLKTGPFSECALVSTCNRTEIYGVLNDLSAESEPPDVWKRMTAVLTQVKALTGDLDPTHFYFLRSCHAAQHLFKVATGADSMIIGDIQVLSQIKEAFRLADSTDALGPFLRRLMQSAYHVAKRARTETMITEGAVSVSYAAVELAGKIFADIATRKALLIGAGETGELTAKHLFGRGIGHLFVTNRTRSKAEQIVASLGGTVTEFESFQNKLDHVDIVISSVTGPGYILSKYNVSRSMKRRSHRPLVIIDLGMPRNIEPQSRSVENLFLYDIDSLQNVVDQNLQRRKSEIPRVNAIVLEELREFSAWIKSLQILPTINDLRTHFEQIRAEEVAKHINRFTEHDRELLNLVSKRIINKLLHTPSVELRNNHRTGASERMQTVQVVRQLFGLGKLKGTESEEK